jgi:hypothetical protein
MLFFFFRTSSKEEEEEEKYEKGKSTRIQGSARIPQCSSLLLANQVHHSMLI